MAFIIVALFIAYALLKINDYPADARGMLFLALILLSLHVFLGIMQVLG